MASPLRTWTVIWPMALACSALALAEDRVAIIVNKNNTETRLSRAEIREYLLLEKLTWRGNKPVAIFVRKDGRERDLMLKKVYDKKAPELRTHILTKKTSQQGHATALSSDQAVLDRVRRDPYAIGYINASFLDPSVVPVTVDGKSHTSSDYPLILVDED